MVPEGRRHGTSDVWTIGKAAFRAIPVVYGTRGACDPACAGHGHTGHRPPAGAVGVDDLSGDTAQRGDAQRRAGVSGHCRAMACRTGHPAPEACEACSQRGAADLCAGASGWHGCRPGRCRGARADGTLERPAARTSAGPALGQGVESAADRPPLAARLPRGRDDAHQPRGHLPVALRARPRGAAARADGLPAYPGRRCACRGSAPVDAASPLSSWR